jgi:hypothetical protein
VKRRQLFVVILAGTLLLTACETKRQVLVHRGLTWCGDNLYYLEQVYERTQTVGKHNANAVSINDVVRVMKWDETEPEEVAVVDGIWDRTVPECYLDQQLLLVRRTQPTGLSELLSIDVANSELTTVKKLYVSVDPWDGEYEFIEQISSSSQGDILLTLSNKTFWITDIDPESAVLPIRTESLVDPMEKADWSPDGTQIVFQDWLAQEPIEDGPGSQLMVMNLELNTLAIIPVSGNYPQFVDDHSIIYQLSNGLYVLDLLNQETTQVWSGHNNQPFWCCSIGGLVAVGSITEFSSDGEEFTVLIDLNTGITAQMYGNEAGSVAISPDGRYIAMIEHIGNANGTEITVLGR